MLCEVLRALSTHFADRPARFAAALLIAILEALLTGSGDVAHRRQNLGSTDYERGSDLALCIDENGRRGTAGAEGPASYEPIVDEHR